MSLNPQIRTFKDIKTESVWRSSDHWMMLHDHAPEVIYSRHFTYEEALNSHPSDTRIYPFRFNPATGIVSPVPWALMDGEIVIDDWNYWTPEIASPVQIVAGGSKSWQLRTGNGRAANGACSFPVCPGLRPSPRCRVEADGNVTAVWVWEKDS